MRASELINYLCQTLGPHRPVEAAVDVAETNGGVFHFDQPFGFVLTVLSPERIALFAPLPLIANAQRAETLGRLLEANLQGTETGSGTMCMTAEGNLGYRDVIDLVDLDLRAVQLRFIDFSLYYDYWRSEGARLLGQEHDHPPDMGDMIRI